MKIGKAKRFFGFWGGLLVWLLFSSPVFAASQTASPTSCVSATGIGSVAWTNPGNALAADALYATASVNGSITNYLKCTGFGFTIPSTAMIMGVTVTILRKSNSTSNGGIKDSAVRLIQNGTVGTTDRSTTTVYPTTAASEDHGGIVDKWGVAWQPSDIDASTFGVAYAATKASGSGSAETVSVDQIQVTVNYLPCSAPSNIPSGVNVTCYCDNFASTAYPFPQSPIFSGAGWTVSNSDGLGNPYVNTTSNLLRLTENTGNNAKSATVPGIFPAAGNYISVEFQHFAYNGSAPGADGVAVTLSDSSVPAVPGAFGGSLGYAQKVPPAVTSNVVGFQGGWLGVALDEWGNFQNPTEGRILGPGQTSESIGLRGPGSGINGYRWIGGSSSNPGGLSIDNQSSTTPSQGYLYQVIVDATNSTTGTVNVSVNRDATTRDGSNFASLFGPFNAYTEATYAQSQGWITNIVPNYWKISFTGSTGGANNIHEIGALRVCAQTAYPPTGTTASGFSAIDEAYPVATNSIPAYQNFQTGDIYMKLQGTAFKLWVAALTSSGISSAYSATSNKYVQVNLVDNTDSSCTSCNSTCTNKSPVESGGTQIMTFTSSDKGGKLSSSFTLNSAYQKLAAVMKECTTSACSSYTTAIACSVDSFSVRPKSVTLSSTDLVSSGTYKAGAAFHLTATVPGVAGVNSGYTGTLKINNTSVAAQTKVSANATPAISPGTFGAAVSSSGQATAPDPAGNVTFSFNETGSFTLAASTGVYDGVVSSVECPGGATSSQCDTAKSTTWTGVDSISTKNDCVADSSSNTMDASGKYGCNLGLATAFPFPRFIPDHFDISNASITARSDFNGGTGCTPASTFTYMGEPFSVQFTLTARTANNGTTKNYTSTSATFSSLASDWTLYKGANANTMGLWVVDDNYPAGGTNTCTVYFSRTSPNYYTNFVCTGGVTKSSISASSPRAVISGTPTASAWTDGVANYTANLILQKNATVDGPYDNFYVGIYPQDSDGVAPLASAVTLSADYSPPTSPVNDRVPLGSTKLRYGILRVNNSYGSELLNLAVPAYAMYWNGSAYVVNTLDSCTSLSATNMQFGNKLGGLASATVSLLSGATLSNGAGTMLVSKPTYSSTASKGSVDLSSTTPLSTYLPGTGRLVFGVFKNNQVIYLREIH